ncbi:site-specific recombinase XerD [Modicisalibacter xianhensis]|uniref:Site-specific recombinase XerD n=1 Tax=Modicisalibacter xianhensis TaxID=442341 RepID=A0A4R8FYH8_9GAMM|nr:tyrosine-type recombinase/integrase [Halomonas xianhensis]TDX32141.1 site-specific recombinase XerD [Halomonas xianhensis]
MTATPFDTRYGMPRIREGLTPEARRLLTQSVSPNTVRAMQADLRVYRQAGGRLPASDIEIANYLSDQNALGKKPATLERYANSLHMWHRYMNLPSPVHTMAVRSVMRGIKRSRDMRQASAPALRLQDLHILLDQLNRGTLHGLRDAAMFTLSFYGAFRRSEVVAITLDDIEWCPQGIVITVHHSKTNQSGRIETKSLMRAPGSTVYCPVRLLEAWIQASGVQRGAVFRAVTPAGRLGAGRLTDHALYLRMKQALKSAGLVNMGYTPHSFRAGFITEAHLRGKSDVQIKRISGHRDQRTFERYIRLADLFEDPAGDFFEL